MCAKEPTSLGRRIAITLLRGYQYLLSPFFGYGSCRFYPTCSQYMIEAIQQHGILKGFYLGSKRLLRCHPYCEGGVDPVPEKFALFSASKGEKKTDKNHS